MICLLNYTSFHIDIFSGNKKTHIFGRRYGFSLFQYSLTIDATVNTTDIFNKLRISIFRGFTDIPFTIFTFEDIVKQLQAGLLASGSFY